MMNAPDALQLETLNTVVDEFATATDIASVLVDIHGQEISRYHNFTDFCKIMRTRESTAHLCKKCDRFGGLEASKFKEPRPYFCHAGLVDFAVPIVVNNQINGFVLSGQVVIENKSNFQIIQDQQTNWQNDPALRQSYAKVKTMSYEKLNSSAELLRKIIEYYIPQKYNDLEELHPEERIQFAFKTTQGESITKQNSEVTKALDYIEQNINKRITLEEVADHVYLNQYYFSKVFKKEMNINFIHYVNQRKMEEAKVLLTESQRSVESIAFHLGFTQPSYFCKVFKNTTEMTPISYRQATQSD